MKSGQHNEIEKGLKALEKVVKQKITIVNAFKRDDIGGITLIYGFEGDASKKFKGGYGISKIIAKRDTEGESGIDVAKKLIEVIIKGTISRITDSNERIFIQHDGYEAVLSLKLADKKVTWLLTGYKLSNGLKGESEIVYDTFTPTKTGTIRFHSCPVALNPLLNAKVQKSNQKQSPAQKIIKDYASFDGKVIHRKDINSFLMNLQKLIKTKQIRKKDKEAKTIEHIQNQIINLLKDGPSLVEIKIKNVEKYKQEALGFIPFVFSSLVSSHIQNKLQDAFGKKKPKALNGVKSSKKIVKTNKKTLAGPENTIPTDDLFTRGDQRKTVDAPNTFTLSGEIGKLVQKITPYRYAIVLTGDFGSGKTQVLTQLIDAFADKNKSIGWFSLEQGGMESKDTIDAIDRNIKPANHKKFSITGDAPAGIETIKQYAEKFDVIAVDSWQKLKIPATQFDELRTQFPNTIWIIIFQQNAEGGVKGGSAPGFDANVVLKVHKVDNTFVNNYAELIKNRGNTLGLKYMVASKKCNPLIEIETKKIQTKSIKK